MSEISDKAAEPMMNFRRPSGLNSEMYLMKRVIFLLLKIFQNNPRKVIVLKKKEPMKRKAEKNRSHQLNLRKMKKKTFRNLQW